MIGREERSETDILVEDEETLEDLELMFVGNCAADLVMQLRICKRLLNLQALIR